MRKLVVLLAAAIAFLMIPATAFAVPPEVVEEFEEEIPPEFDEYLTEYCAIGVDIYFETAYGLKITEYYNQDSEVVSIKIRLKGENRFTAPDNGTYVVNKYVWTRTVDLIDGTEKTTGIEWGGSLRSPSFGVLWNNTGMEVVDLETGDILARHGREETTDPFPLICAALAG